ncbi:MAG: phytanoyl-CoA dioxygenase family protein [Pseudomonadota bacterium]
MTLTDKQLTHYHQHGYVLVPGLIDPDRLAAYNERFEAFATGVLPTVEAMKVMRDVMVVKGAVTPATPLHGVNKLANFEADPALYAYAREPRLVAAVQRIAGDALYTISTNIFNKPPGLDGRHPLHQDLRYFRLRPADQIVAAWTAIDPATRESGCLAVIPGSHRGELRTHADPDWDFVNAGFFAAGDIDIEHRKHVEMQPGDTLLFHPLLIHGSGSNRSDRFRRAISTHYANAACESPNRDWRIGKQARPLG